MTFKRYGHCPGCYFQLQGRSTYCHRCEREVDPMLAVSCVAGDTGGAYDIRDKPAVRQPLKALSPWWYVVAIVAGVAISFLK